MYRCVLADPPWKYHDKLRMGVARSAEDHYKRVMTTDQICRLTEETGQHTAGFLKLMDHPIADDAALFLWVTGPFLLNGDGPRVCRAWGFEPKQLFTWVKGDLRNDAIVGPLGMGWQFRVDTEHLILATRGRVPALRHDQHNYVFVAPKGEHSAKPEELYDVIETQVPGPYLELFARQRREGWDAVGDELPIDTSDTMNEVKV